MQGNKLLSLITRASVAAIALCAASPWSLAQVATTSSSTSPSSTTSTTAGTGAATTTTPPIGSAFAPAVTTVPDGVSSSSGLITKTVNTGGTTATFGAATFSGPDNTNFLSILPPTPTSGSTTTGGTTTGSTSTGGTTGGGTTSGATTGGGTTLGNPKGTGSTPTTTNLIVNTGDTVYTQDFNLTTATRVAPAAGSTTPSPFVTINGIQNPAITLEAYHPGDANDLNFSSFGAWNSNTTAANVTGGFGVIASGQDTPVGAIPTTGTATYNGATTGFVQVGSSAETRIRGTASVTANFASGAINSNFNVPGQFVFTGTGNVVTGTNTYTGTTNTTSVANAALPAAMTGDLRGAFYGPAAQETAGTWSLKGGQAQAMGAFGGKK